MEALTERRRRLLKIARAKGDRLAVATLETALRPITESEMRALWGDR